MRRVLAISDGIATVSFVRLTSNLKNVYVMLPVADAELELELDKEVIHFIKAWVGTKK